MGLAAVAAAALDAPAGTGATLVGAAWLGSMLPDADRAGSRLYRRTRLERRHLPARAAGALARLPLRVLVVLPHRGPTHSLLGCALAATLTGLLVSSFAPALSVAAGAGIAIGSIAHVAGDACTPAGVPLHWPLSRRRRWLLPAPARIPTGSRRESAVTTLLSGALLIAVVLLSS